jgi:hypothetical protein
MGSTHFSCPYWTEDRRCLPGHADRNVLRQPAGNRAAEHLQKRARFRQAQGRKRAGGPRDRTIDLAAADRNQPQSRSSMLAPMLISSSIGNQTSRS